MAENPVTVVRNAAINAFASRVGDLVSLVWDHSLGLVVNLICLSCITEKLSKEMKQLQELRNDLGTLAQSQALQPETRIADRISGWMTRVENLESKFKDFDDSFGCQSICIAGLCLGYRADKLRKEVKELMEEGSAFPRGELVRPRLPDAVQVVPFHVSRSSLAGSAATLQQLEDLVKKEGVGIIGIYGMGGVGKTTLLKIINDEFLMGSEVREKFDVAIWVTVSKKANALGIQKAIGDRLGLSLSDNVPEEEEELSRVLERQAGTLFGKLHEKSFLLLLDDVWEAFDLEQIGIPVGVQALGMQSKVVFTTRSEQVCNQMDVRDDRVHVECLDPRSSWNLFESKLKREVVESLGDASKRQLAEQVVAKCGGLPISLITVGRAMANATNPEKWREAISKLDYYADKLSGMDKVLASLKYSFDLLANDALRSCLLYCGLFPEDYDIPEGRIIDYWVCEGFLEPDENHDDNNIEDTRIRGHGIISELQDACLLESGNEQDGKSLKLHDTVRDMVLWIMGEQDCIVLAGQENKGPLPKLAKWESAKRISVMHNNVIREPPPCQLRCPDLTTLLLSDSILGRRFPEGFFAHMPKLLVLDLSDSPLELFPEAITGLVQLRYLNLQSSRLSSLPEGFGKLVNLRHLILEQAALGSIPAEAILPLSRLQILNMRWSYQFGGRQQSSPPSSALEQQLEVSHLENLKRLDELSLVVCSWPSLENLADSDALPRCVIRLQVGLQPDFPSGAMVCSKIRKLPKLRELALGGIKLWEGELCFLPGELPNLEVLRLSNFTTKASICLSDHGSGQCGLHFKSLHRLYVSRCHGFTDLTWTVHLTALEVIAVSDCRGMTELWRHEDGLLHDTRPSPFSKVKKMFLVNLPRLRRISTRPSLFPSLERIYVKDCSLLKQLPFGSESAKKLRVIVGERTWWDELEWSNNVDGSSVETNFRPRFRPF